MEVSLVIYIGVTGWGDHDSLYTAQISPRDKLEEYAGHFSTVEVDTAFYALYTHIRDKIRIYVYYQRKPLIY